MCTVIQSALSVLGFFFNSCGGYFQRISPSLRAAAFWCTTNWGGGDIGIELSCYTGTGLVKESNCKKKLTNLIAGAHS